MSGTVEGGDIGRREGLEYPTRELVWGWRGKLMMPLSRDDVWCPTKCPAIPFTRIASPIDIHFDIK